MSGNITKRGIVAFICIIIIFIGLILYSLFPDNSPEENGNPLGIDPASLPFNERWYFNAILDKTQYYHEENITLTINLTCLIDHNITGFVSYYSLMDVTIYLPNGTHWNEFSVSSSISYTYYTFKTGKQYLFRDTNVFYLSDGNQTENTPNFDTDHILPPFTPGNYSFLISAHRVGGHTLSIPFTILTE